MNTTDEKVFLIGDLAGYTALCPSSTQITGSPVFLGTLIGFQRGIKIIFSLLYEEDNIVFSPLRFENLLYDNNLL